MSTTTKYLAISAHIKAAIENGHYAVNEKLPQGRLLAEKYGVSELTISKALNLLVRDGYIVRRRGSGSFVQELKNKQLTKFAPLAGSTSAHNGEVESVVIGFTTEIPTPEIAEKLSVDQETLVYKIIRLRIIKGFPAVIEYIWMPITIIPNLTLNELESSIYAYIAETLHLKIKSAHVNVAGVRPNALEKKYLQLSDQDFLMQVDQVGYLADGRIFEFSIAKHLPEEFTFETVFIAEE
ncbi:MAG: GntR family transcriptional regulator [Enterococcus sp.]